MSLGTRTAHLTGEALDALQEGVLLSDADGLVVDVNVAACRILGLSADDILGWPVAALAHEPVDVRGEPLTEREHPSERTSRTGRECTAVVGLRRAGRRLWLHMSSTPSLDRKSTRLNSSHANISYAVFCLKKKKKLNSDMQSVKDYCT